MIRLRTFALLVLVGLIVLPAGQSSAQVKYVDENGNSHWVQSENQVPERYQGKATKPDLPMILQGDGTAGRALDNNLQGLRSKATADEWESAVRRCKTSTPGPEFDAYVSGAGRVKMVGTTQARFAFSKCMTNSGQGLEPSR